MRRLVLAGTVSATAGRACIGAFGGLGLYRYTCTPLFERVWELRDTVSAYDAMYVALAESLDCALVTADARLGRVPGIRCAVTVVPG